MPQYRGNFVYRLGQECGTAPPPPTVNACSRMGLLPSVRSLLLCAQGSFPPCPPLAPALGITAMFCEKASFRCTENTGRPNISAENGVIGIFLIRNKGADNGTENAPDFAAILPRFSHHLLCLWCFFHRSCDSTTASKTQHGYIIDAFLWHFQCISMGRFFGAFFFFFNGPKIQQAQFLTPQH